VIPTRTPAKWRAERPGRPDAAKRSRTRAEENTSANALAAPPTKRSARKGVSPDVAAMAPVVSPLAARLPSSQARREPGSPGTVAASAPAR
jgi:hypothetical protein